MLCGIFYTVLPGKFSHQFGNKDTIFWVEGVSDLAYELCYFFDISVNLIPTKLWHLVQLRCDFFLGISKYFS